MPVDPATTWTIGHSTRTLEVFLGLLVEYRIEAIADVRRFPGSRRYPHFASEALAGSLPAHGIAYQWIPKLGGRRKVQPESPNTAWRNPSFRGYADYMQTDEFAANVDAVIELAQTRTCALMCAEAVPWHCHRSLVADALLVRGVPVDDIIDARQRKPHKLTPFAHVEGLRITYPPEQSQLDFGPA